MNVEELRDYCLSMGSDVEERFPFTKFRAAEAVLVFYVRGHMFCYFDIDNLGIVTVKHDPAQIAALKEEYPCITNPYNMSPKHWIGIDVLHADDALTKRLIRESYERVKNNSR